MSKSTASKVRPANASRGEGRLVPDAVIVLHLGAVGEPIAVGDLGDLQPAVAQVSKLHSRQPTHSGTRKSPGPGPFSAGPSDEISRLRRSGRSAYPRRTPRRSCR